MTVGESGDTQAAGVARMIQTMVDYSRWPVRSDPVRLCVVGAARHAGRFDRLALADGRETSRRAVSAASAGSAGCDVVYLGQMDMAAMRQVTATVRNKPILSIAEADPLCRSQAMFCLTFEPRALSFQLNIDAVSRSAVKVDPRVLRLARGGG